MDTGRFTSNVVPDGLRAIDAVLSSLAFRDLVALSGGHDFLLQASNPMCADTAFAALQLPWLAGPLDAQGISALRTGGASFASAVLGQAVAAPATGAGSDVLLLFSPLDMLFDAEDQCRVRARVRVALGSLLVVPTEPGLVHGLRPGEAVEQTLDAVSRVSRALLAAGAALAAPPQALRTRDDAHASPIGGVISDANRAAAILEADRHVDLGGRASFEVSAWLGNGVLEVAAPFAADADRASATIRVTADVSETAGQFTDLSGDAAVLLSDADPLGLVAATTRRVRMRNRLRLIDDISLVGGPATANVNHLDALAPDVFPCGHGRCPLNVAATTVPGRVAARTTVEFIGASRYGVVWSADAVRVLIQYCWETGAFPRGITQTQTAGIQVKVDGVEQAAEAISVFHLDTLDAIALEYDANGRSDVLYTGGTARVLPQLIRLADGSELAPKDAADPRFAPSDPLPWGALGELTEQAATASSPDLLRFERAVANGVTARLGRPFTEPDDDAAVTDSRISASMQRVALLVL